MILITGGSASGKSEYAESLIVNSQFKRRIYIATMEPFGEEARVRITKHQEMRKLKKFDTIECYGLLSDTDSWKELEKCDMNTTVLFECISNYLSNNMFGEDGLQENIEKKVDRMILDLQLLDQISGELIIISNEVFTSGCVYDDTTLQYMRYIGILNCRLAELSHSVYEVVCGIPICHKKSVARLSESGY